MNRRLRMALPVIAALTAGTAFTAPAVAGEVTVTFVQPERFTDAGRAPIERQRTMDALTRHLIALGMRDLPADQTLAIEVTDVDLAGRIPPTSIHDVRIVDGRVDFPRIKMHYTLTGPDGKVQRSADESVTDMGYLDHLSVGYSSDALRYEKQMLDGWFQDRFVAQNAARH